MRKVYIAGPYKNKERIRAERDTLKATGLFNSLSTWLDETEPPNVQLADVPLEKLDEYAKRDITEVKAADWLILDTLDENPRGGREVEYGIALALHKVTIVIGPDRNLFHRMATYHFDSWEQFFAQLHVKLLGEII